MTADLKPCPFCGSDDAEQIEGDRNAGQSGDWCAIRCEKCEAEGPHVWDFPKAIAAWNRRDPAVLARDETVLAMVGAVIEEAAKQGDPWDGPVTKNKIVDAQAIAAQQIKARIRALAPADAAAALAAHDKRIRDEALADAAKFCRLRIMQNSPATDQDQAVAIDEAEVIEAAILRMKGAKP